MKKNPTALDVIGIPTEEEEQIQVFRWAHAMRGRWPELRLLFHVPNGGSRGRIEAVKFKQAGVKAGVPDLFLPAPKGEYHGLFIEMKRRKGGRVSEDQKLWIKELRQNGYRVEVCKGWNEAVEVLEDYLRGHMKRGEGHVSNGHAAGV